MKSRYCPVKFPSIITLRSIERHVLYVPGVDGMMWWLEGGQSTEGEGRITLLSLPSMSTSTVLYSTISRNLISGALGLIGPFLTAADATMACFPEEAPLFMGDVSSGVILSPRHRHLA